MPEYLAPGVYVEETSFRAKSIEGVGTSTTAFVGLTLKGPSPGGTTPDLLTSFADFERVYGGLNDLKFGDTSIPNYLAYAVQAYFANGGSRLYVARVLPARAQAGVSSDLVAGDPGEVRFQARFSGEVGNGQVILTEKTTPISRQTLGSAPLGSILRVSGSPEKYFLKQANTKSLTDWQNTAVNPAVALADSDFNAPPTPPSAPVPTLELITLNVTLRDRDGNEAAYEDLGFSPNHPRWMGSILANQPARRADPVSNPSAITVSGVNPLALRQALAPTTEPIALTGGTNGDAPTLQNYQDALNTLESLEDISILAAPGYSALPETIYQGVEQALLTYVARRRAYQIAVLDTPPGATLNGARAARSRIDSTRAALYYPWVVTTNPLARPGDARVPAEITLPPSGFICGIYARNDVERGVYKAPANEIVRGVLRFETDINFAQQEVLNPLGINCLRFFPGRGYRVWGARTVSSDPEWKYVNIRRYFNYLEASIDRSTQWIVFEPNGERLWSNVLETISAFLFNEWRSGALLGSQPEQAFFVRCDRSTMTQNDLDNGRLICLIGVAAIKPAEFVIFRIGQKTADARE
jgi:uncharacterized protein